jgi:hypothetical protein
MQIRNALAAVRRSTLSQDRFSYVLESLRKLFSLARFNLRLIRLWRMRERDGVRAHEAIHPHH